MASLPNTSCIGVACIVVWTMARIANATADKTPAQLSRASRSALPRKPRVAIMTVWSIYVDLDLLWSLPDPYYLGS
jgi:hypothetical protein